MSATPTPGAVIAGYLALRKAKDDIKNRHKDELAPINDKIEKLEAFMLNVLNSAKVDSMAFKGVGTMFKQTVTSVTVENWSDTLAWIQEHGAWELLEQRVSKTVIQDYAEHNEGMVPPGVKLTQDVEVRVRKT
jgi:hypothetical protein